MVTRRKGELPTPEASNDAPSDAAKRCAQSAAASSCMAVRPAVVDGRQERVHADGTVASVPAAASVRRIALDVLLAARAGRGSAGGEGRVVVVRRRRGEAGRQEKGRRDQVLEGKDDELANLGDDDGREPLCSKGVADTEFNIGSAEGGQEGDALLCSRKRTLSRIQPLPK